MQVMVNGVAATVDDGLTVAILVRDRVGEDRHVAVARNGEVVPRAAWESTRLAAGDSIEVLAPTAGG
ncbi:MAG TPA: sulfur carrier protein ThiS [Pilimelia sp.]|nr:sulfur carrier protein ThiS [Pilimelia sp.]